jgi:hypothetical protein
MKLFTTIIIAIVFSAITVLSMKLLGPNNFVTQVAEEVLEADLGKPLTVYPGPVPKKK